LPANWIARRSVTPEDGGCRDLAERLARVGFALEPVRLREVSNLWARRGDARPSSVSWATPTSCLRPNREWDSDPFVHPARRKLSAAARDMKTSIAAFVVAVEVVAKYPPHKGSIALLITSDEEGPAVDALRR